MSIEDVGVSMEGHVATVELRRPPNNFLDSDLIACLASALEALDEDDNCRSGVLAAAGKQFCAGANLKKRLDEGQPTQARRRHLYHEAQRLIKTRKPIVAAVHGSAIGAGLGLALVADFRVTCKEARLAANFTALGFADRLVDQDKVRQTAQEMAAELAQIAPLALQAARQTVRLDLVTAFRAATEREALEQQVLRGTNDFKEGVKASNERRQPQFTGT